MLIRWYATSSIYFHGSPTSLILQQCKSMCTCHIDTEPQWQMICHNCFWLCYTFFHFLLVYFELKLCGTYLRVLASNMQHFCNSAKVVASLLSSWESVVSLENYKKILQPIICVEFGFYLEWQTLGGDRIFSA